MSDEYVSSIRDELEQMVQYCELSIIKNEVTDVDTINEIQNTLLEAQNATTEDETAEKVIRAYKLFQTVDVENSGDRIQKLSDGFESAIEAVKEAGYEVN